MEKTEMEKAEMKHCVEQLASCDQWREIEKGNEREGK